MKILLIEDTRAFAALMTTRLTSFGHDVEVAENGEIGVEKFAVWSPDLVLMDITMPVMNGFEAANRIRAKEATQSWAWTPIIFLTATDTPENLITAIEAGGDDFMSKQVPESVLQAKMKAMTRIAALRERLSFANRRLEELASLDGLTGLVNRRQMDLRTDMAWVDAERRKTGFALFMIDVDNFKKYNDHYGHQAGDDCLKAVAKAIDGVIRATNAEKLTEDAFAARYGGEEFAVIVPGASQPVYDHLGGALVAAVCTLSLPHVFNTAWGTVTISAGGCRVEHAGGELATLFRCADQRLYQAKAAGRNCARTEDVEDA
jgi:diguanylate cyclase (GGDEF)-like protein